MVINDFPMRHSCKRLNTLRNFLRANFTCLFLEQYRSDMGMKPCLPDTQR